MQIFSMDRPVRLLSKQSNCPAKCKSSGKSAVSASESPERAVRWRKRCLWL